MISKTVMAFLPSLLKIRKKEPICAYIYDIHALKNHVQHLRETLPGYCSLYYAVKANPDPSILQALEKDIDGFDTASEGEIVKVLSLSDKPIIFGAPAKKDKELEYLSKGKLQTVNIESERDMQRLNRLGSMEGKKLSVLIRVNSTYHVANSSHRMTGVPTQFGIEEDVIPTLLKKLVEFPYLEVKGFHFHAMSNNLDALDHLKFISFCRDRMLGWKAQFSLTSATTLNAGGGIGVNYHQPENPFDWETFSSGLYQMEDTFTHEQDFYQTFLFLNDTNVLKQVIEWLILHMTANIQSGSGDQYSYAVYIQHHNLNSLILEKVKELMKLKGFY